MADLTPQEAAALLSLIPGALTQAIETEQAIAILDMEGDMKQRIFLDGEDAEGGQIGKYSTEPIYVSVSGAFAKYGSQIPTSKLKGRGKYGAKARKSQYFPDGWSGFRSFMGRAVDKVNLKLTGQLSNSIASGTERGVSTIAFTNDTARKKAEGNEEHFKVTKGTIFAGSDSEIDALTDRLRIAAEETLDKLIAG